MNYSKLFSCLILMSMAGSVCAQEKKWNVAAPADEPFKEVSFTTTEGTWMDLDVSPDGKDIVFDLLGDIYIMPVTGGTAKVLRQGLPMEVQPRFSPDGKKILFTSDAGGGDNIWVMDKDGSNAHQITKESFHLLNNAAWTPDGQYIIARKHFTSQRSLGAGELWLYHISGGGGLQLTQRKNDQQDLNEPVVSPEGRFIYYSEDLYPGGSFQYNKDPNNQIFAIRRFDRQKGKIEEVTGGPGGAVRPQLSHNGKYLSFIKRVRTKTVLYIRNLETGEEWPVYDHLSKDQQEAWTIFGAFPGYAWMPDDQSLLIWSEGHIKRINVNAPNEATDIPFTVQVKQRITDAVRFKQDHNPDMVDVHVVRHAVTSPDGQWLVFNAVGYLWKKKLPEGRPERITSGSDFEYEPSFSPDGKSLVYVTWNDTAMGAVYKLNFMGNAKPVKLIQEKGIYRSPSFSPDGKLVTYQKDGGDNIMGSVFCVKPGVYLVSANGGTPQFVSEKGAFPNFNHTGDRIYYQTGGNQFGALNKTFGSYKLDGSDDRTIFKSTYGNQFTVSPDGQWIAFADLHKVYISAFPFIGKTIDLNSGTTDFPVKQVAKDAGFNLQWTGDSKKLHYTLGSQYYTIDLADRFDFVGGKPDSLFKMPESGIPVNLQVKADKPQGLIAFTNARIITMNNNEVIDHGTILIDGNLIKTVGKSGEVTIPQDAKVIDVAGKTIMPGFVDAHGHGNHFSSGLSTQKFWPYYANLAYGVTTMHDPSANNEFVFAQSELVKAGAIVGPRVFSTGTIIYGADGDFKSVINSIDDARSALRRNKAFGAFSVKSYNQPRREQNQMIIKAARELNLEVVPEGGSFFFHNLAMINDGHTTVEHNLPIAPLYNDVIQLWKSAGTAYTPTLIVCYGGVS